MPTIRQPTAPAIGPSCSKSSPVLGDWVLLPHTVVQCSVIITLMNKDKRGKVMPVRMIPIQLPEPLFQRLKCAADLTHRSVEEMAATALEAALPLVPDLPPDIANELAAMHLLSDEALWAATVPSFSPTQEHRLNQLNMAAAERALTPDECAEQDSLISAYRRSVLRRAKAFAILAQRGHRVPVTDEANAADDGRS